MDKGNNLLLKFLKFDIICGIFFSIDDDKMGKNSGLPLKFWAPRLQLLI